MSSDRSLKTNYPRPTIPDRRPIAGGEQPVLPGSDSRRGGEPSEISQAHVAVGARRGEGAALVHHRRAGALGSVQSDRDAESQKMCRVDDGGGEGALAAGAPPLC